MNELGKAEVRIPGCAETKHAKVYEFRLSPGVQRESFDSTAWTLRGPIRSDFWGVPLNTRLKIISKRPVCVCVRARVCVCVCARARARVCVCLLLVL